MSGKVWKVWKLSGVLNVLDILSGKCLEISFSLVSLTIHWNLRCAFVCENFENIQDTFVLMKILYNPVFY